MQPAVESKEGRYNITLPPKMNDDLTWLSVELSTTKAEIMRKALMLLKHAVQADEVKLIHKSEKGDEEQRVLLK